MLKRQRLHAVEEANRIITEREQRIAQQLHEPKPKQVVPLQTDADGDIRMGHTSAAVSPLSAPTVMPEFQIDGQGLDADVVLRTVDRGIDIGWLADDAVDLISTTVEDFRGQRLSMVQSLRQFVLCYETVIEWVWRLQERGGAVGATSRNGRYRSGSLIM